MVLATTNENEQDESKELTMLIASTNKKASASKTLLKKLREDTEAFGPEEKQSEVKIRVNLTSTLARKFIDVMKEYQNAQTKYKTDIKKKVKRQVQIIKPDATAEEIDAVLKSGGGSGEVMKGAILKVRMDEYSALRSIADNSIAFTHCSCTLHPSLVIIDRREMPLTRLEMHLRMLHRSIRTCWC